MQTPCRRWLSLLMIGVLLGQAGELEAQQKPITVMPTARLDLGALWLLPRPPDTGFVVHVTGGVAIGWPGSKFDQLYGASLWLYPELSYDHRDTAQRQSHTASLGFGVGYGNLMWIQGGYIARLTAGAVEGNAAVGMRHGLSARLFCTFLNLELSHQLLRAGGNLTNELQLTVGLNLGALAVSAILK